MKLQMISVFVIILAATSASHAPYGGLLHASSGVVTSQGAIGPSGTVTGQGAIGPSGTVTGHGAIGPNGLPNGAVSRAIAATRGIGALSGGHSGSILAAPAIGTGVLGVAGLTRVNALLAAPAIGTGALGVVGLAAANSILSAPAATSAVAPAGLGVSGLGALAGGHGATVLIAPSTVTTINGPTVPSTVITAPSTVTTINGPTAPSTVITAPSSITTIVGALGPAVSTVGLGATGIRAGIAGGLITGAALTSIGSADVITNGGGAIGLSGHGVSVRGPPTASAVISGPSGKIAADGIWGPTATWTSGGHGVHG